MSLNCYKVVGLDLNINPITWCITLDKLLTCQSSSSMKEANSIFLPDSIVMSENAHRKITGVFLRVYGSQQKPEYWRFYTTDGCYVQ